MRPRTTFGTIQVFGGDKGHSGKDVFAKIIHTTLDLQLRPEAQKGMKRHRCRKNGKDETETKELKLVA